MGAVVGRCECVGEECCVGVDVYFSTVYSIHQLVTSTPADLSQSDGVNEAISQSYRVNEAILSQKVYGELIGYPCITCYRLRV